MILSVKQVSNETEVDEKLAALLNNTSAVRAVAAAVEGTIGPKGLDTMLVDRFGDIVVTNDGATILEMMEAGHPAAKMVIKAAQAQQEEIGDGTTTVTLWAGTLIEEGVNQVLKGVPVIRVIEGIRFGIKKALAEFQVRTRYLKDPEDQRVYQVALVAGRGYDSIARLVVEGASLVGYERLKDPYYRLCQVVTAAEGASNEVFTGVLLNKQRMNQEMPEEIDNVKLLIIDDALEIEEIENEALRTEKGFSRYLELQQELKSNLEKIIKIGVNLVLVDRRVDDVAEEMLADAGVMVLQRVSHRELRRAAEHTGARIIKRTGLKKSAADLERSLGRCTRVFEDKKLKNVRLLNGIGKPQVTILVGASTGEIVGEQERIAKDAAAAVQAAVKEGIVPGGGAVDLAVAREVEKSCTKVRGMSAYGIQCVVDALKRPFMQIVNNAGFNALEKLGDAVAAQVEKNNDALGIDCEHGDVKNLEEEGIIDPVSVKIHALKTAGELAEAILRIDRVIKKKESDNKVPGSKTVDRY